MLEWSKCRCRSSYSVLHQHILLISIVVVLFCYRNDCDSLQHLSKFTKVTINYAEKRNDILIGHVRIRNQADKLSTYLLPTQWVRRSATTRDDDDFETLVPGTESQPKIIYYDYLATCVPGMAHILGQELIQLGGQQIELSGTSAVYFRIDEPHIILNILLWCRTAHKIMELLCRTKEPVYTRNDIYSWIRNTIPITDLLLNPIVDNKTGKKTWFTLSVAVTLNNALYIPDDINHSHYTALNIKNALVDGAREISEVEDDIDIDRPSVDVTDSCDVPLVVIVRGIPTQDFHRSRFDSNNNDNTNINDNLQYTTKVSAGAHLSLYRCIHGTGSLHRRGYRANIQIHKAAMKETTAAALLYAAKWHNKCHEAWTNPQQTGIVLMDPMMGSGTFLIEGAMMAADIAPGLMRIKCNIPSSQSPPILRWKVDDTAESTTSIQTIWNTLLIDATKRAQHGIASLHERNIQIIGNDMHDGAYELAISAFKQAGLYNHVQLYCDDCSHWKPTMRSIPTSTIARTLTPSQTSDFDENLTSNVKNTIPWMVVTNPPWGVRLSEDMEQSWEALRTFIRSDDSIVPKMTSSEVWILSGNAEATKHLGLRRNQSVPLQTGDQNLRWLQYILREPNTDTSINKRYTSDKLKVETTRNRYSPSVNTNDVTIYTDKNKIRDSFRSDNRYAAPIDNQRQYGSNGQSNERSYPKEPFSRRSIVPSSRRPRTGEPRGREQQQRQPKPRKPKPSSESRNTDNEWLI